MSAQEKTEQPTPKKLHDARRRGEVARSRELNTAAVVLATAAGLAAAGTHALEHLIRCFELAWQAAGGRIDARATSVLQACTVRGLDAMGPIVVLALAAGTLVGYLQVGPLLTFEPVAPKPERLDPVRGLGNLLSQKQLVELIKSLLKIGVIGWVAWNALADGLRPVVGLAERDASAALEVGSAVVMSLLWRVGAAMAGIAVIDVLYQRWRHRQDHKMTRDELKREHKETEGDPHAKKQRERTHREVLEHAHIEEVRNADVLVVNPTHLAVALRYDEDEHEAPEITAKGQDDLARRMIRAAEESGVPVMRDVPLARALYELELGDEIPEALYEAVAAVLRAAWDEREAGEGATRAGDAPTPGGRSG